MKLCPIVQPIINAKVKVKYWHLIAPRRKILQFLKYILFVLLAISLSFQTVYSKEIGKIKLRVGATSYNTYVWDGKTVKSKTGATCKTTWSFDGGKVKKRCGALSSNTYLWNGKKFRPMTGATGKTTWIWNGTELTRQVGSTSGNTWVFDGHYWSLKQGATGGTSWVVSGFIPIPICVLIILGLITT